MTDEAVERLVEAAREDAARLVEEASNRLKIANVTDVEYRYRIARYPAGTPAHEQPFPMVCDVPVEHLDGPRIPRRSDS